MSIAVLIPPSGDPQAHVAIGLDIAAHLDQPMLALCVRPEKKPAGDTEKKRGKSGKRNDESEGAESRELSENRFVARGDYIDAVREAIGQQLAAQQYGLPAVDVVDIPATVPEIRQWLHQPRETEQLGSVTIELLLIPLIRGADDEVSRLPVHRLFETAHCQTVLVSVSPEWSTRLPLDQILVAGENRSDLRTAVNFGQSLNRNATFRKISDVEEPDRHCLIIGIPGRANHTHLENCAVWNTWRRDARLSATILVNPADSWLERLGTAIDERMRNWFSEYQMSREKRVELSGKLEKGARSSPEYILFMAVATFLASIGLIQGSAAVIIGAMLVAPLMTPLLGAGLAMIYGNKPLFGRAIKTILLGVTISFLIGAGVGLFSLMMPPLLFSGGSLVLTNEMIARSQPNLLDPFIGLAAGLAGGFAIGRDGQIGTVAGVAIAAALVPPIATAGLEAAIVLRACWMDGTLQTVLMLVGRDPGPVLQEHELIESGHRATTNVQLIFAPLMLFVLNACATIIGAFVGLRMVGMHRGRRPRRSQAWVTVVFVGLLLAVIVFLMVLPLITRVA